MRMVNLIDSKEFEEILSNFTKSDYFLEVIYKPDSNVVDEFSFFNLVCQVKVLAKKFLCILTPIESGVPIETLNKIDLTGSIVRLCCKDRFSAHVLGIGIFGIQSTDNRGINKIFSGFARHFCSERSDRKTFYTVLYLLSSHTR